MFGEMREKEKVTSDLARLQAVYTRYKEAGKKSSLMLASFRIFASDVFLQFLGGITSALLNFMSPFLILRLVDFIAAGSSEEELTWETARPGVILSALLIGTQFLSQFILQHVQYA